jgi:threonine/homoserine/homoserine lactone efflux protein
VKLWAPSGFHRQQEARLRKLAAAHRAANRRGRFIADCIILGLFAGSLILMGLVAQKEAALTTREQQLLQRIQLEATR